MSAQDFIPPLLAFFQARFPQLTITPATNIKTKGGFSLPAWNELAVEINAIPAVKKAGVVLKPGSFSTLWRVKEIAKLISVLAQLKGAERVSVRSSSGKKKASSKRPSRLKKSVEGGRGGGRRIAKSSPGAPQSRGRSGAKKSAPKSLPKGSFELHDMKSLSGMYHGEEKIIREEDEEIVLRGNVVGETFPPPDESPPRPAAPPPTASAEDSSGRPALIFTLVGREARQDQAVWGASFDVVVDYGAIAAGKLGAVSSRKLDEAISAPSAELEIVVLPIGFALEGLPEQPLKFENGRLLEAVRFRLRAPRRADLPALGSGPFGISVGLKQSSTLIHSFFLEIHLVDWLHDEVRPTPVIDFDLGEVAAANLEQRRGILFIMSEGASWKIYWKIDGEASNARVASIVTPAALKAQYDAFVIADLTRIANSSLWKNVDAAMGLPNDDAARKAAREVMQAAVTAGSKIYRILAAEEIFRRALERVDRLPDGSKISVVTDSAVFPWELLYPLRYNDGYPEENYDPKKLWGNRFVFETLLVAPAEEKYPSNRKQSGKLHVSMGMNDSIDGEAVWAGRPLLPVKLQKDYFDAALSANGDYAVGHAQVLISIRRKPPDASLIYFFCHGTADRLEFEKAKPFTPFEVDGPEFPNWALVFVNACDAGNISPLSFVSFRSAFRERKSAGLIAPCFPIPTLFAAVFAKAFIERYVAGDTVGDILFDLRRKLLAADNPLGLWYSLQCPLDLKAP